MESQTNLDGTHWNHIKKGKKVFQLKHLKKSLKFRPEIFKLILKLRQTIREKNKLLSNFKRQFELRKVSVDKQNVSSQTEDLETLSELEEPIRAVVQSSSPKPQNSTKASGWVTDQNNGQNEKSISEQVKEVAQSAMAQSGMVFVESAGMYYDYKTGYYYNSELGLYYHTDTNCYYYYSEEKKTFVFHSYPDTSKNAASEAFMKHERRKAKKHKQEIENGDPNETKKTKKSGKTKKEKSEKGQKTTKKPKELKKDDVTIVDSEMSHYGDKGEEYNTEVVDLSDAELEDGECSESGDESSDGENSCASTSTADSDDDAVAKHHPPCMRIIVRETELPKLKVGSLFLVTKDGGTIGREGDQHTILLKDTNVSRNHLDIKYDTERRAYVATDLGSKNGTILNGNRMCDSQEKSFPMEVPHGSTIQLGETKLLCHIHPGNDTCGHCEPGLVMAADDKDKKTAYTRTCSVQKQHALELARLKNKYVPEPLAIEETAYNDRAKARRETVGSSHGAEKTQQSDLNTEIASENKGFKLLKKMGWSKGEGLGKDSQGHTEPIPLVNNENKVGLGAAGSAAPVTVGSVGSVPLKMRTRNKSLRPPARLFRDPLEEDDD